MLDYNIFFVTKILGIFIDFDWKCFLFALSYGGLVTYKLGVLSYQSRVKKGNLQVKIKILLDSWSEKPLSIYLKVQLCEMKKHYRFLVLRIS